MAYVLEYPEDIQKIRRCDICREAIVWVCVWRDGEAVGHFYCLRENDS